MMRMPLDSTSEPAADRGAAIEDEYELSPMQQGMLYDTVAASDPGMYCIVVSYRISGPLDADALFEAWRTVVARHSVLRTSFHWRDRAQPAQTVHREIVLPVDRLDWRAFDSASQRSRLIALLEQEQRRGFDVTKAPLLRLTLVQCADDVHELVVAHHHLLLDGSCKPLLFAEVFATYEAIGGRAQADLQEPAPYRLFIEWLGRQDSVEAERFWRNELAGVKEPTPLWPAVARPSKPEPGYREHQFALDGAGTDRLKSFARAQRLTANTVVSGAWALLLAHASRRTEVVFGATVNARPPDLDGADAMLGLFINTLPVRFRIAPAAGLVEWLRDAQLHQTRARDFDYAPLSSMQRWSDVPRGAALFESIIVFENNIGFGAGSERHGSVEITDVQAHIRNSLPLTLRCVPGRALSMQLLYDTARFTPAAVQSIAGQLVSVLDAMPASADAPVQRLLDLVEEVERRETTRSADAFQQSVRDRLSQRRRRPESEMRES